MNLEKFNNRFISVKEVITLSEFLKRAKKDASLYAGPHDRLLKAIGKPVHVDTSKDPRLSRLFGNKVIKTYSSFSDFYGLEVVIEKIVNFLSFAAQNLEERKQILYLFGPPGSAKSSLADRLKSLMEKEPFYSLAIETSEGLEISPIHESPLGLFTESDAEELGLPAHLFDLIPSPWALKKIEELGGLSKFKVVKLYPSKLSQIAIAKTEPGDENNQDISTLVGKIDIRKLEHYAQNDPNSYRFSGGLCLANRGILDFVEMFKAPINILNPLLEATQGKNYNATEALSPIPFEGIIIAHSNEAEWETFRNNKTNEAFLDRIYLIKVPYCLRVTEEKEIYKKQLRSSSLANASCVPHSLDILAKFAVLTRLEVNEEDGLVDIKLSIYDGKNIKDKHPSAKSYLEYRDLVDKLEGFSGLSTRAAFKILSQTFNYDSDEIACDPVHILQQIRTYIEETDLKEEIKDNYLTFQKDFLVPEYYQLVGKDIQAACLDSYDDFGQHMMDRYIKYADYWLEERDYRDPDTGQIFSQKALETELELIEMPMEVRNNKDFRHEVVNFCLRHQAKHNGKNPNWKSYQKLREVIEASLFKDVDKLIGVLSFDVVKDTDQAEKNAKFVANMKEKGYTEKQIRRNVEWYQRYTKSNK